MTNSYPNREIVRHKIFDKAIFLLILRLILSDANKLAKKPDV